MNQPTYATLIPLPVELPGDRIVLRPLRPADGPAIHEAINESRPELEEFMVWPPRMRTVDDCVDYCARMAAAWIRRDGLTFGIFERETGRYLGGTGFHNIDWRLRGFETGYWIRTTAVGNGYVTEAVRLLTRLAFSELQGRRLEIRCDATNLRSRAIPERLGFVLEATLRKNMLTPSGSPRDTLVFALTDDDYHDLPDDSPLR